MAEPELELQSLGRCILGAFRALSNATWDVTEENGFPSKDRISTEHQRFILWAQSLGLNQVGHASLDYRVRDASIVKASLADLLVELGEHLENLASIILGNRKALEQDPDPSHGDAALSDDQSSLSSLSSFGSFKEVDFRLESVSKRLDSLYELASRIRNPRSRPQRPVNDLYKHIPERERADYIESQKQIEIFRVSHLHQQHLQRDFTLEKLRELNMTQDQFLEEYSSTQQWLIRRTGIANARRKQQFEYWRTHAELLARDMTENEIPVPMAPTAVQSPVSESESVLEPKPVLESKSVLGNPIPSVSMATSVTRLHPDTPGLGDTESVISTHSRVSTAISPTGEELTWPAPPMELAGNKYFMCPYCRVLCPDRYLRRDEWRRHQIHDLQPYHCTYENCTDPNRTYRLRQDWIDHENQHRRVWHCHVHQQEFETQPEYMQHLQDRQDGHTPDDGLPEMVAAVVSSSAQPHRDCPFCPIAFVDVPTMQKHVRYHLERLAMYALPDVDEQEGGELVSGNSSDSRRPMDNHSDSSRDKFIAIGIDFGTIFSGVSWAFSEQPGNIHEISEWPTSNHISQSEVQVPSVYDIDSGKWGYQVTPDMMPVKWFKLLLLNDSDLAKEDISLSKRLRQSRKELSDHPSKISAIIIVGLYLKKLWDHTYAMLKTMFDIDNILLRVAITVPGIWPYYAQKAMREAAKLAGITAKRAIGATALDLVQEPEAASLSMMREHGLLSDIKPGESFVVCDAGGGTVDGISYTVVSKYPPHLKECVKGEGGLWGAVQIDEAFEAHLLRKNRLRIDRLSTSEYNMLVIEDWERGIKRTFTNGETPTEFSLRFPMKVFKTRDRLRNRDHFSVNRSEVYGFFGKSLTGIRTLVANQFKHVKKETGKLPRNILLVGGLGSSPHVHGVLNSLFDGTVLRPSNGQVWSTVARGAVIRLLHDKVLSQETLSASQQRMLATLPSVTARKSRYSYGIEVDVHVAELVDYNETLDKTFRSQAGDMVTRRMKWFLKRGEELSIRSPVTYSFHRYYREPIPKTCTLSIQYSSAEPPPKRPDHTVIDLCAIECDFDTGFDEWELVGDPDQGYRKCDNLELMMIFTGEPSWNFRIGAQKATTMNARIEYMNGR